jgi:hypothetical protein
MTCGGQVPDPSCPGCQRRSEPPKGGIHFDPVAGPFLAATSVAYGVGSSGHQEVVWVPRGSVVVHPAPSAKRSRGNPTFGFPLPRGTRFLFPFPLDSPDRRSGAAREVCGPGRAGEQMADWTGGGLRFEAGSARRRQLCAANLPTRIPDAPADPTLVQLRADVGGSRCLEHGRRPEYLPSHRRGRHHGSPHARRHGSGLPPGAPADRHELRHQHRPLDRDPARASRPNTGRDPSGSGPGRHTRRVPVHRGLRNANAFARAPTCTRNATCTGDPAPLALGEALARQRRPASSAEHAARRGRVAGLGRRRRASPAAAEHRTTKHGRRWSRGSRRTHLLRTRSRRLDRAAPSGRTFARPHPRRAAAPALLRLDGFEQPIRWRQAFGSGTRGSDDALTGFGPAWPSETLAAGTYLLTVARGADVRSRHTLHLVNGQVSRERIRVP